MFQQRMIRPRFRCNRPVGLPALLVLIAASFSPAEQLAAQDAEPIAHWGFGQEESTPLESHGGVHRDVPGPRPETYPDFTADNTAVKLDGKGARFTFADPGDDSPFDFTNGDAITLEAWVKVSQINEGDNVYVIGKGRTGNPGFARDNQNWALRVRRLDGRVCISLLFSSVLPNNAKPRGTENWHRWTSDRGFTPDKQWHHVAIAYRFGEPDSIVGVIDGIEVGGKWDEGGPTKNPPRVDNDAIWIGSALGGSYSNSLRGELDEVAIYREALPVAVLKKRYRGPNKTLSALPLPEVMPELGDLPADAVQLTLHEGMPAHYRWRNEGETISEPAVSWQTSCFLVDGLPHNYDSWGIRDSWNAPLLLRMAADVPLPPGKQRLMMRVRGVSRLWVNGEIIARSKPMIKAQNGFEKMTPPTPAPKPGLRIAQHRQQEVFGTANIPDAGTSRVVLEIIVGGKDFRADPGETCVALETADGESFVLLSPQHSAEATKGDPLELTDATVTSLLNGQERQLLLLNDKRRRAAATSQEPFWEKRHQLAKTWAAKHSAPAVPGTKESLSAIDAFLMAKVEKAAQPDPGVSVEQARHFHDQVLPLLQKHCFRCHGEKSQGGLRLDSLDAARLGGDSTLPAVTPGDPDDSELLRRLRTDSIEERMPPGGAGLSEEEIAVLEKWIADDASWPSTPVTAEDLKFAPIASDAAFLRRVYLDTVGVVPTAAETEAFLQDRSSTKREAVIDRLLKDERWADHWTSYWLDVLAENPTLINASLNTTGPFRWFVYESFRDNKPMDQFATELILMRGSRYEGGSAGFAIAANNDAPFAAKGQILASAFLGMELQCARCHDSPYHSTTQKDLYSLAAMLERKPVKVPGTSRVPAAFFEEQQRQSLIQVTLKPGEPVDPVWPFADLIEDENELALQELMRSPNDSREQLAAYITSPQNARFAEVIVNRVWRRLIGTGLIDSPHDWEGKAASHPELLQWLANDFISHNYDLKHLARRILTSQLYQRETRPKAKTVTPETQFFLAPDQRRMTAEQLVDSLHVSVGKPMDVEEITFAPEGGARSQYRQTLGKPNRAWMFANLANERDRPSLSLPRARAIADVMEAFGWDGARQSPRTDRETDPNVLQPGVLQNSDALVLITRTTRQSGLAELAMQAKTPEELVEQLYLSILTRYPTQEELAALTPLLADGFNNRKLPPEEWKQPEPLEPLPVVTWSNHTQPEANSIAIEMEQRARKGPAPDPRLNPEWRKAFEDVTWSLVNLSEYVWIP
ncbi:MAG: DUF1553 domain-containing protein [Rubinisphaera brasiliensis]|uniref:DUF1553 domain-containing protein n=1 Tax=Rubinisphaera brasiliensis TaxID=119 RepID=UPI0039191D43